MVVHEEICLQNTTSVHLSQKQNYTVIAGIQPIEGSHASIFTVKLHQIGIFSLKRQDLNQSATQHTHILFGVCYNLEIAAYLCGEARQYWEQH